jgi:hypothetical protein
LRCGAARAGDEDESGTAGTGGILSVRQRPVVGQKKRGRPELSPQRARVTRSLNPFSPATAWPWPRRVRAPITFLEVPTNKPIAQIDTWVFDQWLPTSCCRLENKGVGICSGPSSLFCHPGSAKSMLFAPTGPCCLQAPGKLGYRPMAARNSGGVASEAFFTMG